MFLLIHCTIDIILLMHNCFKCVLLFLIMNSCTKSSFLFFAIGNSFTISWNISISILWNKDVISRELSNCNLSLFVVTLFNFSIFVDMPTCSGNDARPESNGIYTGHTVHVTVKLSKWTAAYLATQDQCYSFYINDCNVYQMLKSRTHSNGSFEECTKHSLLTKIT